MLLRWRRLRRIKRQISGGRVDTESGRVQSVRLKSFEQVDLVGSGQKGEDQRLLDGQEVERVRKEEEVFGIGDDDDEEHDL